MAIDGDPVEINDVRGVQEYLSGNEITIKVDVGIGEQSANIYTCDLTHAYININAILKRNLHETLQVFNFYPSRLNHISLFGDP